MTSEPATPNRLLTVPEVAQRLVLSSKQVRRLIAGRDLPHIRIGTRVRITQEDLENYIARMRQARPL